MHWALLSIGIGIELLATTALKLSDGFTKLGFAGVTLIGALAFGQTLDGFAYLGIGLIITGASYLTRCPRQRVVSTQSRHRV